MTRQHLDKCALELSKLPLSGTHPGTGLSVWLLLCLVADARERVERGISG
jgi:hypothetical protein